MPFIVIVIMLSVVMLNVVATHKPLSSNVWVGLPFLSLNFIVKSPLP
jgi:hypothetical protein